MNTRGRRDRFNGATEEARACSMGPLSSLPPGEPARARSSAVSCRLHVEAKRPPRRAGHVVDLLFVPVIAVPTVLACTRAFRSATFRVALAFVCGARPPWAAQTFRRRSPRLCAAPRPGGCPYRLSYSIRAPSGSASYSSPGRADRSGRGRQRAIPRWAVMTTAGR